MSAALVSTSNGSCLRFDWKGNADRKIPGVNLLERTMAQDADIIMADGSAMRLSDFWKRGRLVLVFLRHFG